MYIKMGCIFCHEPLEWQEEHSGKGYFDLYKCKNCMRPDFETLYRQLYNIGGTTLLSDAVRVDEYYVVRYFQLSSKNAKYNFSIIFKEVIGVLESNPDMEPITFNKPVCELDFIIDLPFDNVKLAKRKLDVWTVFS